MKIRKQKEQEMNTEEKERQDKKRKDRKRKVEERRDHNTEGDAMKGSLDGGRKRWRQRNGCSIR